ncbi:MAG TPA: alpha/beta hydrolase, partial [Sphingobacteriaceae bacterium]
MVIRSIIGCILGLLLAVPVSVFSQSTVDKKKEYLTDILQINVAQKFRENTRRTTWQDSTWTDWLKRSGELPPDFSVMPHIPFLPEPLVQVENGKETIIRSKKDWAERREWIKKEYQRWISGTTPPPPGDFKVSILSDKLESGIRIQLIQLNFGPGGKAKMTLELMIPEGTGPFPVYMTQWTHRGWAQLAVRRGYIACVYAAADSKDDTEAYQMLYPEFDFSMLMRRAWGASRVVDYLMTLNNVNKKQIAITGHSRNGKQSLWAAAFDERITAVISTSSSTGGDSPWRFGDPQYASETLDLVTAYNSHWFHPRLRFFFGREDQLPVDQNLLGALIAPRALLYHYSIVERGLNPWAIEQNYYSVKKVYDFFNAADNIGVYTRYGEHAVAARDIEYAIDFLDVQFKRRDLVWQNNLYYQYDYQAWEKEHSKEKADAANINPVYLKDSYESIQSFDTDKKQIVDNLQWILGNAPSGVKPTQIADAVPGRRDWLSQVVDLP